MTETLTEVVAAALYDASGNLLLARRGSDDSAESGMWEFPGGKVEPGESLQEASRREIAEELDIELDTVQVVPRARAVDRRRGLALNLLTATVDTQQPKCRVHRELRWVRPHRCIQFPLGALDRQLAKWAGAPIKYHITHSADQPARKLIEDNGKVDRSWLLARWPESTDQNYTHRLRRLIECCGSVPYMLHNRLDGRSLVPAAVGTHLSAGLAGSYVRRPVSPQQWLCVSCHNADELAHAAKLEADFVVLGAVRETDSHPGEPGIGWPAFAHLTQAVTMPVLALGGVRPADLPRAIESGGHGVAGISAFWQKQS